jgi:hypothetical protein
VRDDLAAYDALMVNDTANRTTKTGEQAPQQRGSNKKTRLHDDSAVQAARDDLTRFAAAAAPSL